MIKIVNGQLVEMTPEEVAAWEAEQAIEVTPPPPPPLALELIGGVSMTVAEWEVTAVDRLKGIAMAFMISETVAWVIFTEAQPDTDYIVTPADGVTKYNEYFEVDCSGATSKNLIVQRVQ